MGAIKVRASSRDPPKLHAHRFGTCLNPFKGRRFTGCRQMEQPHGPRAGDRDQRRSEQLSGRGTSDLVRDQPHGFAATHHGEGSVEETTRAGLVHPL